MALINCRNCSNQISDKANNCIHCGISILPNTNNDCKQSSLTIVWDGMYTLFDSKTKIYINGLFHSNQSNRKGYTITIPIENENIKIKFSFLFSFLFGSVKLDLNVDPEYSYKLKLLYDKDWGRYSEEYELIQV